MKWMDVYSRLIQGERMKEYIEKRELRDWLSERRETAEMAGDYTREMTYREVIKKIDD